MANTTQSRKWTVMIYLAGDNNLAAEMIWSIKEMKRVNNIGPDGPVTVLVLFDPPAGLPPQGYVITSGDQDNLLINEARPASEFLGADKKGKTNEALNTGDPKTLLRFISHGLDNYD